MAKFQIVGETGIADGQGRVIATCTTPADAATVLTALSGATAKIARKARKGTWHWPPPVYVAAYADGHATRMSFASPGGKPIDVEAARHQALLHRPVKVYSPEYPLGMPTGEHVAMMAFHVEHNGAWIGGDAEHARAA